MNDKRKILEEFQRAYPTREDKEQALQRMTDAEIRQLIEATRNIQAKIFYKTRGKQ